MKELDIKLTVNELNCILEALGNLPYIRVYELISQLQNQARGQLNGAATGLAANPAGPVSPAAMPSTAAQPG